MCYGFLFHSYLILTPLFLSSFYPHVLSVGQFLQSGKVWYFIFSFKMIFPLIKNRRINSTVFF